MLLIATGSASAADQKAEAKTPAADSRGVAAAVALNYCRASFHRIRQNPTQWVLLEEEEMILNNLNLNGIVDQEVIKLYSDVLDEINQVQMADKEREIFRDKYQYAFRQRLGINALALTTELMTFQFGAAIRTGANSWWDYRTTTWNREHDVWKVDKARMTSVMNKSSSFLDTFWKMTQKKNIPDEWLVRGDDLDRLDACLKEPNPAVRLRVLKRMERYMEAYPPYWYYVARTQQALGQLFAAAQTYEKLAELGAGHFRNDEMLAAGMANRAMIQEYLGQPGSVETAREALHYATDVPEANLMCARVLQRHGHYAEAEEALLRNLDVDLESRHSLVALLSIYYESRNEGKLVTRLSNPKTLQIVPVPILVRCLTRISPEKRPEVLMQHLATSLYAAAALRFGPDEIVVVGSPSWQFESANIDLQVLGRQLQRPQIQTDEKLIRMHCPSQVEFGNPLTKSPQGLSMTLKLHYPQLSEFTVQLQQISTGSTSGGSEEAIMLSATESTIPPSAMRVVAMQMDGHLLQFLPSAEPIDQPATPQPEAIEPVATQRPTEPAAAAPPVPVAVPVRSPVAPVAPLPGELVSPTAVEGKVVPVLPSR